MKITVNLISNIFLAFILAVLPYMALIKVFLKSYDTPFLTFDMVIIIIVNIIVYILAVLGLELAENQAKAVDKKTRLSSLLFILMLLPVLLKYIIGMSISVIPALSGSLILYADDLILILFTVILIRLFYKYSKYAAYLLIPLLLFNIYTAFF
ncbi:MAG: hypothetical protein SPF17_01115 [Candidatus Mucispirillum faecigallinarum]|nr:hypothetical protein [Candidatus Mucispirillum faecigallinarum]